MATGTSKDPCDNSILLKAFQSILSDPDFGLPSQPAIEARISASCALSWCEKHQKETSDFLTVLQKQLKTCLVSTAVKLSTRKERMWEYFFKLRSSSEFEVLWKEFLVRCGTDSKPAVYQHITDIIFKDIVSKHFAVEVQNEGSVQVQLDYNEKNALRYVGGYVTRVLHTRLEKSNNEKKRELCACLTEMNDVDPDEMCDNSDDWMKSVDRGGLKHITNMVYMFFVSVELVIRTHLQGLDQPSFNSVKDKIVEEDDVQFYWSIISVNWEDETATTLLNMIVDMWMKIRGHSTAKAWLESYKLNQKKFVQKSKGIRKQLMSSKSSTSTTASTE